MDDNAPPRPVEFVSLIADLSFSSKVRAVANERDRVCTNARRLSALIEVVGPATTGLVVDLTHPEAFAALEWNGSRPEGSIPTLGFYPHVEHELAECARRYSFVQVVTRSKLDGVLSSFIV